MPNTKRNARLAKWMGWEPETVLENSGDGWETTPPDYRTDPAAALELLGWLAEEPRRWEAIIVSNCGGVELVTVSLAQRGDDGVCGPPFVCAEVIGPPSIALPAAIAKVAGAVLDMEEGDDGQ